VASGGRHLQGALRRELAADVAKIVRTLIDCRIGGNRIRTRWCKLLRFCEQRNHFGQMFHAIDPDAIDNSGFRCVLGREDEIFDPLLAGADRDGESASNRTDGAIQGEFSNREMFVQGFEYTHSAENPESHREIEAGAFLADVRGREVYRDGLVRVTEARVHKRRLDALAAFADGGVGHADEHEIPRHAAAEEIHFNVYGVSVNTEYGCAAGFEQRQRRTSPRAKSRWKEVV